MASSAVLVPADKVLFEELCTLLDSLKIKKKNEKVISLTNYIDDFRLRVAQITEEKVIYYLNFTFFNKNYSERKTHKRFVSRIPLSILS